MEIRITNLKKNYKDKLILEIDELIINKGKITGIIGLNGAGKTTLLNIIAGLDKNFIGDVRYDGQILNKQISKKLTIVFQKPYLFRRSVYENIFYPLRVRNVDKSLGKEKVDKLLKRFEINSLRNQNAHTLSGGETQKVALARSMVFKPQLLLLDEPTSNIDSDSLKTLEREILNYNNTGATVVIVTHSMEQAKRLCTDFVYIDNGRVVK